MSELHEDHGPDCACGCHDNDNEHDHRGHYHHEHERGHHDHGHEHGHEREVVLDWGTAILESHEHDQAATVSATVRARDDAGKTFQTLVEALQTVAQRVELEGGIVGHIKAYAKSEDSFAHASATDAQHAPASEGDLQLALSSTAQCQFVAIALLIGLDELELIVSDALAV